MTWKVAISAMHRARGGLEKGSVPADIQVTPFIVAQPIRNFIGEFEHFVLNINLLVL